MTRECHDFWQFKGAPRAAKPATPLLSLHRNFRAKNGQQPISWMQRSMLAVLSAIIDRAMASAWWRGLQATPLRPDQGSR
jgi:hypothetical protein